MTEEPSSERAHRPMVFFGVGAWLLTLASAVLMPFPYLGLLALPGFPGAVLFLAVHAFLRRSRAGWPGVAGAALGTLGGLVLLGATAAAAMERAGAIEAASRSRSYDSEWLRLAIVWLAGMALTVAGDALASRRPAEAVVVALAFGSTLPAAVILVGQLARAWPLTD